MARSRTTGDSSSSAARIISSPRGPSGRASSAAKRLECSSIDRIARSDLEDFGALLEHLRLARQALGRRAHLLHRNEILAGDEGDGLDRIDHHLATPLLLPDRLG